ncbi:hypothetical protein V6N13_027279 [Hibiscus sabdariffa]
MVVMAFMSSSSPLGMKLMLVVVILVATIIVSSSSAFASTISFTTTSSSCGVNFCREFQSMFLLLLLTNFSLMNQQRTLQLINRKLFEDMSFLNGTHHKIEFLCHGA